MWPFNQEKYPAWGLGLYEGWVMHIANPLFWRCSTNKHLLNLYTRNVTRAHCDVGVGSGFYLGHPALTVLDEGPSSVTLVDVEEAPLSTASRRIERAHPEVDISKARMDILSGTVAVPGAPFDSLSLTYLVHCLDAPVDDKARVLGNLKNYVKPDGIVFGATILGSTKADHSMAARLLIVILKAMGFFFNDDDDPQVFEKALEQNFQHVDCRIVGSVLLFEARGPMS